MQNYELLAAILISLGISVFGLIIVIQTISKKHPKLTKPDAENVYHNTPPEITNSQADYNDRGIITKFIENAIKVIVACGLLWLFAHVIADIFGSPNGTVDNCKGSGYSRSCD